MPDDREEILIRRGTRLDYLNERRREKSTNYTIYGVLCLFGWVALSLSIVIFKIEDIALTLIQNAILVTVSLSILFGVMAAYYSWRAGESHWWYAIGQAEYSEADDE